MSKSHPTPVVLRGLVASHNVSPKGDLEGLLLESDKGIVQLNFPKGLHESVARYPVGSSVELHGKLEEDEYDHPVYELAPEDAALRGKVARLNYARHGEVNGFVLTDGTFVHQKPEGAKKHPVRVGQTVRVTGERRAGSVATVIEATDVKRESPAKGGRRDAASSPA